MQQDDRGKNRVIAYAINKQVNNPNRSDRGDRLANALGVRSKS